MSVQCFASRLRRKRLLGRSAADVAVFNVQVPSRQLEELQVYRSSFIGHRLPSEALAKEGST